MSCKRSPGFGGTVARPTSTAWPVLRFARRSVRRFHADDAAADHVAGSQSHARTRAVGDRVARGADPFVVRRCRRRSRLARWRRGRGTSTTGRSVTACAHISSATRRTAWSRRRASGVRGGQSSCGVDLALIAGLAVHDKHSPDDAFRAVLSLIERAGAVAGTSSRRPSTGRCGRWGVERRTDPRGD